MANITSIWVSSFLLYILHIVPCLAGNGHPSSAPLKSYLPAEGDSNSVTLVSPNGMFELIVLTWSSPFGRFCMAGVSHVKVSEHPMIWAAHDAEPFQLSLSQSCRFYLSEEGDLLLQYDADKAAWHTGTGGMGVSNLTLLDNGNLVLFADRGSVAWQSFEQKRIFHMISGMNFTSNMVMTSATDFAGAGLP
ncbi:hypothetical protein KP509_20G063700 [Ceratopteris richardii]|uniref:Bulb-type lectin domain-containing protein n=1 Tax=Ceratopteris richardii TaxID=49495 RepID=A0A8T2SJE2_CERRI|nr:hypothetical protein KP509_20G063700 [Ceratopteris richardii]